VPGSGGSPTGRRGATAAEKKRYQGQHRALD
jgi:hypothetical protein